MLKIIVAQYLNQYVGFQKRTIKFKIEGGKGR